MIILALVAAAIFADSLVVWGPVIALVTAVLVALIAGRYQLKSAETTQKTAEDSVLLSGYNQLVSALQSQVNEVQQDNRNSTERAITAEATAHRAILATQECERRGESDKAEFQAKLDQLVRKHNTDIAELKSKHDRELAALSREIAVIRNQQSQQGDK